MDRVVCPLECMWFARPGRWRHKWPPAVLSQINGETAAIQPHRKPEPSARTPGGDNEQGSWRRCGPLPGTRREPAPRARRTTRRCAHRCRRRFPVASGQLRDQGTPPARRPTTRFCAVFTRNASAEKKDTLSLRQTGWAGRDFVQKKLRQCWNGRRALESSQGGKVIRYC